MALIKCKECGAEISDTVSSCPKCGCIFKKPKGCLQQGAKVVAGGFVAMIALGVLMVTCAKLSSKDDATKGSQGGEAQAAKVGDTLTSAKYEMSVTQFETRSRVGKRHPGGGKQLFEKTPADGGIFVAVQWKFKNITDKPLSSFNHPRIKLLDPKGTEYSADVSASGSYATELDLTFKIMSDLNPGITVTHADVFEVSEANFNPKTWKLQIRADKKFVINLE